MTTQELINRAELSDRIFEALSHTYSYTVKMKYDEKEQRNVMERAVGFRQQDGSIPFEVSPQEAVREFFNRL